MSERPHLGLVDVLAAQLTLEIARVLLAVRIDCRVSGCLAERSIALVQRCGSKDLESGTDLLLGARLRTLRVS